MDAGSVAIAAAIGFLGGVSGGLLGVGGGILFVPALVFFLGLSQVAGESTSLLAIVPVAVLGAWRQRRYGNVRLVAGLWIGALSIPGVLVGTALANALSQRALAVAFAGLQVFLAVGLARRAVRGRREATRS
ncbi:MAG: sulfite exporter TauE/SafE family protein [Actinobacteria bacterium]|nr:sulfite exporter TauE/SafE family protein [Actinomycetota bacterium]